VKYETLVPPPERENAMLNVRVGTFVRGRERGPPAPQKEGWTLARQGGGQLLSEGGSKFSREGGGGGNNAVL